MKKILIYALSFFGLLTYAQNYSTSVGGINFRAMHDTGKEKALGSMYVSTNFFPAKINNEEPSVGLRYNAYNDEMEFMKDNTIYYLIKDGSTNIKFIHSDRDYVVATYEKENGDSKMGYLEVLADLNNLVLYKKETIIYRDAVASSTGYDKAKPAEFKRASDEYYIKMNGKIVPFPDGRKDLVKLFPENKDAIINFIKTEKISFSKDADLIKLTRFLSTL